MRTIMIISLLLFKAQVNFAQVFVFVDNQSAQSKEVVRISDEVTFPDIRVQLGRDIPFEDIRVGITNYKNQAHYIITASEIDANQSVLVDNCNNFPDLSVLVAAEVSFPDFRIEFSDNSSFVDILIYTEKITISEQEIIACLLPLIREKTGQ